MNKKTLKESICLFFITMIFMMVLFTVLGIAPFGKAEHTLCSEDAYYQYLDYFGYLHDVYSGDQNIFYSFHTGLGQGMNAFFAYYLASPLNLIILLFDKVHLAEFFDILVMLKISLAAAAMDIYLRARFERSGQFFFYQRLLISTSYALMQWAIHQNSNIFWLDGYILLPLMMLGVFRIVTGDYLWKLAVPTALSVMINWYTGGMNCLFTGIMFVIEFYLCEQKNYRRIVRYFGAMVLGVLFTMMLFLPAIIELRQGKGSSLDIRNLFSLYLTTPIYLIRQYTYDGVSEYGGFGIYAGTMGIVGALLIFSLPTKREYDKLKIISAFAIAMSVLMIIWRPLYTAFNLFKSIEGHEGRYAYLCSFLILFVAANGLEKLGEADMTRFIRLCLVYVIVYYIVLAIWPYGDNQPSYYFGVMLTVGALLIVLTGKHQNKPQLAVVLMVFCVVDLGMNAYLSLPREFGNDASSFAKYNQAALDQITAIEKLEDDHGLPYRVTQTMNRAMAVNGSANFNEAMAFGYMSAESYSSCNDYRQLNFLERLGYRNEIGLIVDKNFSILPIDSLLGIRYIVSSYHPDEGDDQMMHLDIAAANEKEVYQNGYALPMAFGVKDLTGIGEAGNPFEYQNAYYSSLLGKDIKLFIAADPVKTDDESGRTYSVDIPSDGRYMLYANMPWNEYQNETLDLNGRLTIAYSSWNSSSVILVPTTVGDDGAYIHVNSPDDSKLVDEQFYLLDLNALSNACTELRKEIPTSMQIHKNVVQIDMNACESNTLFTSIIYDPAWRVKVNGMKVTPGCFDGTLMTIPIKSGTNHVEMVYIPRGLIAGIILSILSAALLLLEVIKLPLDSTKMV